MWVNSNQLASKSVVFTKENGMHDGKHGLFIYAKVPSLETLVRFSPTSCKVQKVFLEITFYGLSICSMTYGHDYIPALI